MSGEGAVCVDGWYERGTSVVRAWYERGTLPEGYRSESGSSCERWTVLCVWVVHWWHEGGTRRIACWYRSVSGSSCSL